MSARDLYAIIVGEGGFLPSVFFSMRPCEVYDCMEGIRHRDRSLWESARLLADVIYKSHGGRESVGISFPWDADAEESDSDVPSAEELRSLRECADRLAAELNKK